MSRVNILCLLCLLISLALIIGATVALQDVLAFHGWQDAAQPALDTIVELP